MKQSVLQLNSSHLVEHFVQCWIGKCLLPFMYVKPAFSSHETSQYPVSMELQNTRANSLANGTTWLIRAAMVGAILVIVIVGSLGPRVETPIGWPPSSYFICLGVYLSIPALWILFNSQIRFSYGLHGNLC